MVIIIKGRMSINNFVNLFKCKLVLFVSGKVVERLIRDCLYLRSKKIALDASVEIFVHDWFYKTISLQI